MVRLPAGVIRRRIASQSVDRFRYERALGRSGFCSVAGLDEAGRGACAGPLVVSAVVLDVTSRRTHRALVELNDSKQLTPAARDRVFNRIVAVATAYSIVTIDSHEVDALGLHAANLQGMRRALAQLAVEPDYALTDGFPVAGLPVPSLGVWKGDEVCGCVSAAGVLAKVTRDRMMADLHEQYPNYGFDVHKGYVTAAHREALMRLGATPVHRRCFLPVRRALASAGLESVRTAARDLQEGVA